MTCKIDACGLVTERGKERKGLCDRKVKAFFVVDLCPYCCVVDGVMKLEVENVA